MKRRNEDAVSKFKRWKLFNVFKNADRNVVSDETSRSILCEPTMCGNWSKWIRNSLEWNECKNVISLRKELKLKKKNTLINK